jgi:hypothetical protein
MKFFVKFIVLVALVLTSITVCFSSEIDCSVDHKISKNSSHQAQDNSSDSDSDHECKTDNCICVLTCQNGLVNLSNDSSLKPLLLAHNHSFSYQLRSYSEIFITEEKPPII